MQRAMALTYDDRWPNAEAMAAALRRDETPAARPGLGQPSWWQRGFQRTVTTRALNWTVQLLTALISADYWSRAEMLAASVLLLLLVGVSASGCGGSATTLPAPTASVTSTEASPYCCAIFDAGVDCNGHPPADIDSYIYCARGTHGRCNA